ncbi:prolipoprotein diacylglyceryl transferase family protein [Microbacterium aurum]
MEDFAVGGDVPGQGCLRGTLLHPLFLYEMIWNLCGAGVILLLERRFALGWGRSLAVYLIWYGLGRSGLEAIRIDPTSDAPFGIPSEHLCVVRGRRPRHRHHGCSDGSAPRAGAVSVPPGA